MNPVADAAARLEAALRTIPGVRFHSAMGPKVDPPGVVLGLPRLVWQSVCPDPTSATFVVAVVVAFDERAPIQLWDLVPLVVTAIETVPEAVIREPADPGEWAGLPSYQILVEMSL